MDMRKATIIIWRNRHRPEVISELADLLSEVRGRLSMAWWWGLCRAWGDWVGWVGPARFTFVNIFNALPHPLPRPPRQYSDQKTVFEGIEFYLPQLAHMIIHLEVDWPTAALEQFVLIVCQHR